MGQALNKNILKYEFKYSGRKFIILQNHNTASVNGVRFDIQNVTSIVINISLSVREKRLLIHKLITGRTLRNFYNKNKVKMFII